MDSLFSFSSSKFSSKTLLDSDSWTSIVISSVTVSKTSSSYISCGSSLILSCSISSSFCSTSSSIFVSLTSDGSVSSVNLVLDESKSESCFSNSEMWFCICNGSSRITDSWFWMSNRLFSNLFSCSLFVSVICGSWTSSVFSFNSLKIFKI